MAAGAGRARQEEKDALMKPYRNLAGDSGVVAYEIGREHLKVRFSDGATYLYTVRSAGRSNIEHMKLLAQSGRGLSSFISVVVRDRYASKSG